LVDVVLKLVGGAGGVGVAVGVDVGVEVGVGVKLAVAVAVAVGVGVNVSVAVGVGLGGIVAVAVALGSTVAVGVNVAVAVGVGVNVAVAVAVAVGLKVAVAVGVAVNVAVAVAVAVAVGVGVGLGVGVGVGLIVLAVCMAASSASDNAVFQIAACWMLPLAYPVVSKFSLCIKVVRLHVLPVASVAVVEATLVPSTNNLNAVPLRLNAIECQFPSNAVPPEMPLAMTVLLPRARPKACDVVENSPICARSLADVDLEIARAAADPKSVPPLKRAKRVKFLLSRLGITASFLLA